MSNKSGLIVSMRNVQRHYGKRPDLLEKNKRIEESGKCPFCPAGIKKKKFAVLGELDDWNIVLSQFPYPDTVVHILVVPKRHIISSLDLRPLEWVHWPEILRIIKAKYPFIEEGFGIGMREKELGGVTLYHLHFHIIVPKTNIQGFAENPVNFPIG